jgi:curved DNA-binding protein CbpA
MHITEELKNQFKSENYYDRLGLSSKATEEEIKTAYRKLAQMFAYSDQKDCGASFLKNLGEAYEVLIDSQKRAVYDSKLSSTSMDNTSSSAPEIISASEEIKKQIQDSFELLKSKTQNPTLIEIYNECINNNQTNQSISQNLTVLSTLLEIKYNSLLKDKNFTIEFIEKIKELYANQTHSPIDKFNLIFTEIENFEKEKILKENLNTLFQNPMYNREFKEKIKDFSKKSIPLNEKIKMITTLEEHYQKNYIQQNNEHVSEIYNLLETKFPEIEKSKYKIDERKNQSEFFKTYQAVKKLELFFPKFNLQFFLSQKPYSQDSDFTEHVHNLENNQDKTFREKFEGVLRLVQDFNHKNQVNSELENQIKSKSDIKSKLKMYTERIESFKTRSREIDYEHNFLFLKKSRGINRKINYLIALELLNSLSKNSGDFSIFENIEKIRTKIIQKIMTDNNKLINFADRGINSTELNKILKTVKSFKK